jgi:hypothetical protein
MKLLALLLALGLSVGTAYAVPPPACASEPAYEKHCNQ